MARPSKLTSDQWANIRDRLLAGETGRSLGRQFDVSETAIRKRFGSQLSQSSQVRSAADKLVVANIALAALPPSQRPIAIGLADKLRSISDSLASAAELGARTGHRLQALANAEVGRVDDADPLSEESIAALKGVGVLTRLANDSAHIALNLLAANKDAVKKMDDIPPEDSGLELIVRRRDAVKA